VPDEGWTGKENGELLGLAKDLFDAFVTADQNLEYQQNLSAGSIPVIVLVARTNRLSELLPLIPELLAVLGDTLPQGKIIRIAV
jgi:hypothetical protein